jgi:hypothetical protein
MEFDFAPFFICIDVLIKEETFTHTGNEVNISFKGIAEICDVCKQ